MWLIVAAIISIVSLAVIILTELAYRNPLYVRSVNIMKSREPMGEKSMKAWSFYSKMGDSYFEMIIILIMFIGLNCRPRAIYYCLALSAKIFLLDILKMAYMEPRPYWINTGIDVTEHKCSGSYGNPSGHSLMAATLAFVPYLDFMKNAVLSSKHHCCVKIIFGLLAGLVALAYMLTMGYSRFIVGVHTWN